MGGLQSKKRLNKSDTCTQTPIFGRYIVKGEGSLGRCSTFSSPVSASPSGTAAAVRVLSGKPLYPRLNKRPKYDPVYVLWKNAFENQKTRTPRKVSLIREESQYSQNITDAVAGQLTPKGFPPYTDLKKNINRENDANCEEHKEKVSSKIRRRLSLRLSLRRSVPYENTVQIAGAEASQSPTSPPSSPSSAVVANDETSENNYVSASSKVNEQAEFDMCDVIMAENTETTHEEKSSNIKPHFLSKISAERAIIIEKLMTEIKQRNAEKSEESKLNVTISPKRPLQVITAHSPTTRPHSPEFLKKLKNPQADLIEKMYMDTQDWKAPYTIRKGYYYL